jgi:origin recognition complex subunit 4
MHAETAGSDIVTFEMLHECFRDQVKSSTSAPVQVEGGGIGMVQCTREVLMSVRRSLVITAITSILM